MSRGCTDCGYAYIDGQCFISADGSCRRDSEEADYGVNDMTSTNTFNPFPLVKANPKKQTKYEKIKSMSIDEMALLFCKVDFGCEGCAGNFDKSICASEHRRIKAWLNSKEPMD